MSPSMESFMDLRMSGGWAISVSTTSRNACFTFAEHLVSDSVLRFECRKSFREIVGAGDIGRKSVPFKLTDIIDAINFGVFRVDDFRIRVHERFRLRNEGVGDANQMVASLVTTV